ncbi:2661_t:CDS:1, partial [Gigaspora margarita]
SLLNDAAQISNWLDSQKEKDPRWIVERGWDNDNVLTYLMWMTPNQVENWIEFSDCVINDVTHKTNRYRMPLSLFVGFNRNRRNILLAQGLLADESQSSYVWFFEQILKATNIQPTVIMTDSDPAVDAAVKE